jgi:hypothetical protein
LFLFVVILGSYPVGLINDYANNNCHSTIAIVCATLSFVLFILSSLFVVSGGQPRGGFYYVGVFLFILSFICDIITLIILRFKVSYDSTKCEVIPGTTTLKEDSKLLNIIFTIVFIAKLCGASLTYAIVQ